MEIYTFEAFNKMPIAAKCLMCRISETYIIYKNLKPLPNEKIFFKERVPNNYPIFN
jgi:hypothetical protein